GAIGEIVPEHGGRSLCFVDNTQRDVTFSQPHQRLFDMPCSLVLGHDHLEAVDRADEVTLVEIKTPDIHLLAGELIARHADFFCALKAYSLFGYLRTTSCNASIAFSARCWSRDTSTIWS